MKHHPFPDRHLAVTPKPRATLRPRLLEWVAIVLFTIGVMAFAFCAPSCAVSGGKIEVPVYMGFELVNGAGDVTGFVISDTQRTLARNDQAGVAFVRDKATGATLYELRFKAANETLLISKPEDVKLSFPPGALLPFWLSQTWMGQPALVERYGLVFAGPVPP